MLDMISVSVCEWLGLVFDATAHLLVDADSLDGAEVDTGRQRAVLGQIRLHRSGVGLPVEKLELA